MYHVLILENDPIVRKLLEIFVTGNNQYTLSSSMPGEMDPIDLVLMDIAVALEPDGMEDTLKLKRKFPDMRIIIMTDLPEYSYIAQARRMGADSFWYKEASAESLLNIMDNTMAGDSVYPSTTLVTQVGKAYSTDFTERELEVLKEVVGGKTDIAIADSLKLSVSTVKFHIQKIREKTGFTNRTELAVRARESGLVIN